MGLHGDFSIMSRASEITLLIILLQSAIGFVDATGLFTSHYLEVPSNNASYTLTDLEEYTAVTDNNENAIDEVMLFAHWAWETFFIGWKIVGAIVFIFPTLVSLFHVPLILSIFMQVGVYYIYATWAAQYRSGKGWKLIE